MKLRVAILLLIGAVISCASTVASADDLPVHNDAAVIGRLPLDTKLIPATAAAHPVAFDNGSSGKLAVYFLTLGGLVVGGYFILKRGLPLRGIHAAESRLQLRETKMLGNRQFLVVAEYDGTKMLLGVGPGRIEYLCPLEGAEEPPLSPLLTRTPK